MPATPFPRLAFSLRKLLIAGVVLVFCGTVFGVVIGYMHQVSLAADRTAIASSLRQIATAVHSYHDVTKELPPAIGKKHGTSGTAHWHILPGLESRMGLPLYTVKDRLYYFSGDLSQPSEEAWQGKYGYTNIAVNYLALHGGPQKDGKTTFQNSFPDGTENTVLFALRYQMCNGTPTLWGYDQYDSKAPFIGYYNTDMFQVQPSQAECNPKVANTWHPLMQVAMCDASVRTVSPSISPRTWALALHPADGVPNGPDWME